MSFRVQLTNPVQGDWEKFIVENAPKCRKVVREHAGKGKTVVICGAGPSLRETAPHWLSITQGPVWGCNSALLWLLEQGYRCTHGFCIDQTPQTMDEWAAVPDVKYLLASSCYPGLVDELRAKGRDITFFHSFLGTPNEVALYRTLYPGTIMVGDGLNSVNRAIAVAQFMGYERIVVLGADNALGPNDEMHANGDGPLAHGATPVILEGVIDGRRWRTKPDMLFSAADLARKQWKLGKRRLILGGDTLTVALAKHPPAFLDEVARLEKLEHPSTDPAMKAEQRGGVMTSDHFVMPDVERREDGMYLMPVTARTALRPGTTLVMVAPDGTRTEMPVEEAQRLMLAEAA